MSVRAQNIRAAVRAVYVIAIATTPALRAETVASVQSAGVAVPFAEVSIWDVQGRVGAGRTGGIGTVRIELERPMTANPFVLVRRLGFAPARVPLPRGG